MDDPAPVLAADACSPSWNEADRLAALERYAILDTGREEAFDDVAELAADILDAPIAVVNFIAADRQWFKAEVGIGTDTLPLDVSICRHAILQPGVLVVPDLTQDGRFEGNPLVHAAEGLRFYAGALIETRDGLPLGTVCVLDRKARPAGISARQERALTVLAGQTMARLELRRSEAIARHERARAEKHARRLSLVAEASTLLLAGGDQAVAVRDLFALIAEDFRLDVGFHYRCGEGALRLVAAAGLTSEQERAAARIEFGQTVCGIVAARREATHVTSIQSSDDPHVGFLKMLGLDSYFSAPLLAGGDLLGTVSFGRKGEPFSIGELEALRTLVAQLATALEREHAEGAVRESESNYRFAVDLAPQTVWTSGPDGLLDHVGHRWMEWTGTDGLGASWGDVMHPDDLQPSIDAWTRSVTTGVPYDIEHRARMRDGSYRWMHSRAYPRRDENGAIVRWYGTTEDIDDEHRAEQVRRDTEARLGIVVDNATDYAIFTADADRVITSWSAGAAEIFGWSAEEAIGQAADIIFTPEDLAAGRPEHEVSTALEEGCAVDERWHIRKDGRRVFMNGSVRPLPPGPDGRRGVMKIARDETERRRAADALLESERRLRTALDVAALGTFQWHVGTGRVELDARSRAIFGLPDEGEVRAEDVFARIAPEELERVQGAAARSVETRERLEIEYDVIHPDGNRFSIVSLSDVLTRDDGTATVYGTFIDITERRAQQRALQALNAILESQVAERTAERDRMWETSPDLLVVIGFDGVFRRVNPAWTDVLGYRPDELVDHHVNEFVIPDDHRQTTEAYETAARGGRPTVENRYRHKDGSVRRISWVAAPAQDVTYAVGRDVTVEKEQAAALAAAQDALRQAQKMEAVGQLTGGIAHDFNNLLTGIVGSLELLQRRVAEGRYEALGKYAGVAMTSAHRAAALTQRLLAFSRRQPLDPKAVDANKLVASMEDLLRRTLGPQIDLEFVLAGGLWPTLCDPNQLESAILNLAINARDAMADGGRLTVETANAHLDEAYARARGDGVQPGQYVAICVTDTGTGIPPDVAERIFEPFFTTKPIGQGTGLGLSQLYGFVKQSGGHVALYSEPGQGTTFRIYLPRYRGALGSEEETQQAMLSQPVGEGECVLVVEDEAAVRMLITEALDELGYDAIEAVDGPSGLKEIENRRRIDLLVTDVGLPGLNGRQLADAARSIRPDLKVLFITGFAGNAAVGNGLLEPGMEMMTKPFAMDQLAAKIRAMIEG